ncbi:MAG: class I SAM-dependent methyltransferase [Gammaproteobacteria bacterium]|jgi:SAM-dependent methyltransferase|nr:class I SAM-dependent methyltransferase [Gammaproteobacteria bacterium]
MPTQYDTIGKHYTRTRAADPRITGRLLELLDLPSGSRLLDIGAGTGNYSLELARAGFSVDAVEPSLVMRDQAQPHAKLSWHNATAEGLPFGDAEFDGAVMTLSLHHQDNWRQGIREALRVSGGGPLLIFTFDIEYKANFWLFDYFPGFINIDKGWSPTMAELSSFVRNELGATFERFPFPLPPDLVDHFASADWARPEAYLQEEFRRGISSFAKLDEGEEESGVEALRSDLASDAWQCKYGDLLELQEYDRGYLFLRFMQA